MTHPIPDTASAVVERCADDMIGRWANGERPLAEEYLARFPALGDGPDAALELVAEELALRDEYALPTTAADLVRRFPRWPAQLRALLDCHAALAGDLAPAWPRPGDRLGEFALRGELGRGGHGRVYLATQPALSDRPVVLKVGPDDGDEHLSLARLQHSHIVPLYSAHEFPGRNLRGLCLPYFGGATLADVQARLGETRHTLTPADVLTAVRANAAAGLDSLPPGPAWVGLASGSLAGVACRIGACLADALQYAHDRGLLHLDVKPSNVLLAADGVPMLLDFHLARRPVPAGDGGRGRIGGTPGYMAPEHRAAFDAVRNGWAVPTPVDGRADVFALGVVLGEFLRAARCAPTPGLADVLARCTAAKPGDRYRTAADVAADLRRHLGDLPLKGVANRSLTERWGKWRRRRPLALPLALALAALTAAAGAGAVHASRVADGARAALAAGTGHADRGRFAEAADALRGGEALAGGIPFHPELRAELRVARKDAERAKAADDLHALGDRVRWLTAADHLDPAAARVLVRQCREVWDRRAELAAALAGQPTPDRDDRWRADLLDVAVLAADLGARAAGPEEARAARRAALDTLAEAEGLLGPSAALELERGRHLAALGLRDEAAAAARRADALPRKTARDHLTAGRSLRAAGDVPGAAAAFDLALAGDDRSVWPHYYRGCCHLKLGRATEAVAAFSAAVALAPGVGWCVHNRGLAFAAAGFPAAALADFDRAVALDPTLAAAYLGRAAVHHAAGRWADALADLRRAEAAGAAPADVAYRAAVVQVAANDRAAAAASLRACLRTDPGHAAAADLLARLTQEK